ncbi:MAG: hypothetical protein AAF610_07545 [Pseudomonadota bacterium]
MIALAPHRWIAFAATVALSHAALAQSKGNGAAGQDDGRVSPAGPYRSQMRILEPDAKPTLAPAPDTPFTRALGARAAGYLAATEGNLDAAIAGLETALDERGLDPLAESAILADLVQLLAQKGDDDALASRYSETLVRTVPLSGDLHAAAAAALARLERFDDALAACDRALLNAPSDPATVTRLKIVILASLKRYNDAAQLAATQLQLADSDTARWWELIDLYRAAGRGAQAVAVAELGVENGVITSLSDRRRVARLYLDAQLPDHAAVLLTDTLGDLSAVDRRDIERVSSLDLLVTAHRRAANWAAATRTATRLTELAPTSARWRALADAATRLGKPGLARSALTEALKDAPPSDRGRLLMALGEAQVATGDRRAAARSYRAASELGGVYQAAAKALADLAEVQANEADALGETPSSRAVGDPQQQMIEASGTVGQQVAPQRELTSARIPATRFYFAATNATVETIGQRVDKLARRVALSLRRERLVAAGPLRIRVADASDLVAGREVTVQVGVPVRSAVPPRGGLRNIALPAMTAVTRKVDANDATLAAAWSGLLQDALAAGLVPGDDTRTVILATDDEGQPETFELQLAIRGADE